LKDHFEKVGAVEVKEFETAKSSGSAEPKKKARAPKKAKETKEAAKEE
jgi:hypothetical protein